MAKAVTVKDFFRLFPTDDACLDHLMRVRYGETTECPKCRKVGRFARLAKLPAYSCPWCGHHIHPMMGTPFGRTRTPLQKWFFAMYMFTTTRNGVAAKEIQRQMGVTYKTAWRMGHEIRKHMARLDGDSPLGGGETFIEVDEAFVGGRHRTTLEGKTVVLGMVERNGDVITRVIPRPRRKHIFPLVQQWVAPGSKVATDDASQYRALGTLGYRHGSTNHSGGEYVNGNLHTNTIEAVWSILKRMIKGTHIWVSQKHMPKYLGELEYRFNLRHHPHLMFDVLLAAFPKPASPSSAEAPKS